MVYPAPSHREALWEVDWRLSSEADAWTIDLRASPGQ